MNRAAAAQAAVSECMPEFVKVVLLALPCGCAAITYATIHASLSSKVLQLPQPMIIGEVRASSNHIDTGGILSAPCLQRDLVTICYYFGL